MALTGKLLISGGRERADGHLLGEGKYYDKASLVVLDLATGNFEEVVSKQDGGPHYPSETPNQQFAIGCLEGDTLWLPTDTEVHKYSLPDFSLQACFSHPCFHNIHSVHEFDGQLVVTSTGLDNVVILNKQDGEIEKIINTEGKDPWHRFDQNTDYRLVHSTRPHDSHPNFAFKLDGELWVTRCTQEDAVCLTDLSKRIDITGDDVITVHDGVFWGEKLLFTRVDGFLVSCDPKTRKAVEKIDPFEGQRNRPRSWCRGLHVEGDKCYIGYSKLRKTKLKSKLKYLSQGNFKYGAGNNALIVAYDLKKREIERVYDVPEGMLSAIYGVLPFNYDR